MAQGIRRYRVMGLGFKDFLSLWGRGKKHDKAPVKKSFGSLKVTVVPPTSENCLGKTS